MNYRYFQIRDPEPFVFACRRYVEYRTSKGTYIVKTGARLGRRPPRAIRQLLRS